jgi:hypothetical protein
LQDIPRLLPPEIKFLEEAAITGEPRSSSLYRSGSKVKMAGLLDLSRRSTVQAQLLSLYLIRRRVGR